MSFPWGSGTATIPRPSSAKPWTRPIRSLIRIVRSAAANTAAVWSSASPASKEASRLVPSSGYNKAASAASAWSIANTGSSSSMSEDNPFGQVFGLVPGISDGNGDRLAHETQNVVDHRRGVLLLAAQDPEDGQLAGNEGGQLIGAVHRGAAVVAEVEPD